MANTRADSSCPLASNRPRGNNDQEWWPYNYNTAIYSDDRGKTWQTSGPVQSGTGEGTLAELTNGQRLLQLPLSHGRRPPAAALPGATTADTCGRTGKCPTNCSKWANRSTSSTAPNPATAAMPALVALPARSQRRQGHPDLQHARQPGQDACAHDRLGQLRRGQDPGPSSGWCTKGPVRIHH